MLFKKLTSTQEQYFRRWAQKHDPPNIALWDIYHPVCREEWEKRGLKPPTPLQKVHYS